MAGQHVPAWRLPLTKIVRPLAVGLSVLLLVLIAAAPALADGEPATPLSGHTTQLLVIGIVVAAVVVAAWLALFRIARARRRLVKKVQDKGQGAP